MGTSARATHLTPGLRQTAGRCWGVSERRHRIGGLALRGRGERRTFWTLAALSAAIEPCIQGIPLMVLSNGAIGPAAFGAYAIHSYAFNFTAGVTYRRYGLLAPVLVRLANYLTWHVAYGNFFF